MTHQKPTLEWRENGVPVSRQFDDPYYSLDNGVAETTHVFLSGNDLPQRFCDGFHIAELGFGTGLNFLVTLAAWRACGAAGHFRFTSFEAYPMTWAEMRKALQVFDGLPIEVFETAFDDDETPRQLTGPDFHLEVIHGDARETLSNWPHKAHAWFLDGFSPSKNPELWGDALLAGVGDKTAPGGTFATYTAAGFVRRGLEAAGFEVTRAPGFGRKRHMSRGVMA